MTLLFVGLGIYFITFINSGSLDRINTAISQNQNTQSSLQNSKTPIKKHELMNHDLDQMHGQQVNTHTLPNMFKALPYIILMSVFSIVLSIVVVILISKAPKIVIYSMMGFTFLIILAGIIGGILLNIIELTIISAIFGLVWIIFMSVMFCCYRSQF